MDKQAAATLWSALGIEVSRFHAHFREHSKSVFLGYADLVVSVVGLQGMTLKIRGVGVKLLKGNPYLDFPTDKSEDGSYYPIVFPLSAELRAVLTTAVFRSEGVVVTLENAREEMRMREEMDYQDACSHSEGKDEVVVDATLAAALQQGSFMDRVRKLAIEELRKDGVLPKE